MVGDGKGRLRNRARIACLNAAGLLLARGVTRQRMLAISAALGTSRSRLVRQLLTESTVLSLSGGVLGLAAAAVVLRAVPALVPGDVARLNEVGIDGVAFAFTVGLSLLVGLLCGAGAGVPAVARPSGETPMHRPFWRRPTTSGRAWRRTTSRRPAGRDSPRSRDTRSGRRFSGRRISSGTG